jgi:uncharacterized surface protein with fasciclin (FAS1) repeats
MSTILQIINADRNLSLFSKGIKATGLEAKLNETGPFTILGPVNLALGKLESLSFEELLQPGNKQKLAHLLSGYILSGKKMLDDFRNDQKLAMLNGEQVVVSLRNGDTRLNGAKILSHNRQGSNGVIHLLDTTYSVVATE